MEKLDIKKQNEYKVLSKIYSDTSRYIIELCEKPDFTIFDKKTNKNFGVEITELYYNSSSAKLKNIPNFVKDCIENGIPRKDQKILSVNSIYMDFNNKWKYIGNTVGEKIKNIYDYVDALIKTIVMKNEKIDSYQTNDYCELFIQDKENYFFFKETKMLKELYDSDKFIECLNNSKYERIYLFTVVNKQKMLLVFGNIEDGPLAVNNNDFKKHKEYMQSLFEEV